MRVPRGLGAGVLIVALAANACVRPPRIEEPPEKPLSSRSRILASDGTVLATLYVENREPISIESVSGMFIDAVVAAEDQRFWTHEGFDGKAIVRAALRNTGAGQAVQGASTITQQYVKNTYFPIDRPKTFEQKVKEVQLAWKLEQRYSKREILERYLNTVYFGDGAYGVKAAAEQFFAKPVGELTLPEAALLAGLIRSPERDNPRRNPDGALARRGYVIGRMADLGMVAPEEAQAAESSPLGLAPPPRQPVIEPHFVEYVKQTFLEDPAFGETQEERAALLYRGGIDVVTSLDLRLQAIARRAIQGVLGRPLDPEASLVALDPKTGKVLAMIGGRDFEVSQVNLALGSRGGGSGRQPGSAFKPIVLATAFDDGIRPDAVYSSSSPTIRVSRTEVWRPRNSEGRGGGPMTLTTATTHSVNAVFARLGMDVGPARVAAMGRRMGITTKLGAHPSISLGAEEVSVLDMASAFGTLTNYGVNVQASPILGVESSESGQIRPRPRITRALDPGAAWMVTEVLTRVISDGTGTRAQIGRPAAGKTGTSQDYADAWFVGYTPTLVAAVWVGFPGGRFPMNSVHGIRVFGGTFPAMIWRIFMEQALADTPPVAFALPASDMISIDIDPASGLLWGPYCPGRQTVEMLRQLAPTATCAPPPSPSPQPDVSPLTVDGAPEASPGPSPAPTTEPTPEASPSAGP